jgi:hypothetical protein
MKWGAGALALLLMTIWIGSAFVDVAWLKPPTVVSIQFGRLSVAWPDGPNRVVSLMPPTWTFRWQASPQLRMWFFVSSRSGFRFVNVPLWVFALAPAAVFALTWRLDVVAGRGPITRCAGCGYSREGLARGAACPECGREVDVAG